ncbi:cysteine surface protein, putative, partial [Entamoeba invadens IP1]
MISTFLFLLIQNALSVVCQLSSSQNEIDESCQILSASFTTQNLTIKNETTISVSDSLTFQSNSFLCMKDNTTLKIINNLLFYFSIAELSRDSKLITKTIEMHKTQITQNGNAQLNVTGQLLVYDNSLILLFDKTNIFSSLTILSSSNISMMQNTNLFVETTFQLKDNAFLRIFEFSKVVANYLEVLQNGNIESYTTSSIVILNSTVIQNSGQITLQNDSSLYIEQILTIESDSKFSIYDFAYGKIGNYTLVRDNGILVISNNNYFQFNIVEITENGILLVDKKGTFHSKMLLCKNVTIEVRNHSLINTITTKIDSDTIIYTNKIAGESPLFIVHTIAEIQNFSIQNENTDFFDLMYSKEEITIESEQLPKNTFLMMNKTLLRYGLHNELFCHLENEDVKNRLYIENYCPCNIDNCYIAPVGGDDCVFVNITNDEEKNTENENESLPSLPNIIRLSKYTFYIGHKQFIHFHITSNIMNATDINFFNISMSAKVLITSQTPFKIHSLGLSESVLCTIGVIESGTFKCIEYLYNININNNTNINTGYCVNGSIDKITNLCEHCIISNCEKCTIEKCVSCSTNYSLDISSGECVEDNHCLYFGKNRCLKCEEGYSIVDGICQVNKDMCVVKSFGICLKCINNLQLSQSHICILRSSLIEENENEVPCGKGFYKENSVCISCNEKFPNCTLCDFKRCYSCEENYKLYESKCINMNCTADFSTKTDQNGLCHRVIQNCFRIVNGICVECEDNFQMSRYNTCVESLISNCKVSSSSSVCLRCTNNYFLDTTNKRSTQLNSNHNERNCLKCPFQCSECMYNNSFCLKCSSGYYLSDHQCVSNLELKAKCKDYASSGNWCYECSDGYYHHGVDCHPCNQKCSTCVLADTCIVCNTTNFMSSSGECLPQSLIVGCKVEVTQSGCSLCSDGYYLYKTNQCKSCSSQCKQCSNANLCESCFATFVLKNGKCVFYKTIQNCIEEKNSKCEKCKLLNKVNSKGDSCNDISYLFMSLVFIALLLIFFACVFIATSIGIRFIIRKKQLKTMKLNKRIFLLKFTKHKFQTICKGVGVNVKEIDFNEGSEEDGIDVKKETTKFLYVVNLKGKKKSFEIGIKSANESYKIKICPTHFDLEKGECCQIEVQVKPKYTCNISDVLLVGVVDKTKQKVFKEADPPLPKVHHFKNISLPDNIETPKSTQTAEDGIFIHTKSKRTHSSLDFTKDTIPRKSIEMHLENHFSLHNYGFISLSEIPFYARTKITTKLDPNE